jgi:hypothetical protein
MGGMRRTALDLLVFGTLLVLAGCGEQAGSPNQPDAENTGGIPTNLTDPVAIVSSHALALGAKDLAVYLALLEPAAGGRSSEPGFAFYPLDTDVDQFPWMTGDFLERPTNLA